MPGLCLYGLQCPLEALKRDILLVLRIWDIVQPLLHINDKNTAAVFNLWLVPCSDSSSPDFFQEQQALSLHRALLPAQQHWNKIGEFDTVFQKL